MPKIIWKIPTNSTTQIEPTFDVLIPTLLFQKNGHDKNSWDQFVTHLTLKPSVKSLRLIFCCSYTWLLTSNDSFPLLFICEPQVSEIKGLGKHLRCMRGWIPPHDSCGSFLITVKYYLLKICQLMYNAFKGIWFHWSVTKSVPLTSGSLCWLHIGIHWGDIRGLISGFHLQQLYLMVNTS